MNSNKHALQPDPFYGKRIASHLDHGNQLLSYEIAERLRAGRARAVASRKAPQFELNAANNVLVQSNGSIKLSFPSKFRELYNLVASFIPLICLAMGLMLIYEFHNEKIALELAEIDAALLVDDLPPQAYADPAFLDFLKNSTAQKD